MNQDDKPVSLFIENKEDDEYSSHKLTQRRVAEYDIQDPQFTQYVKIDEVRILLKTLAWIRMNSGIAGDGNHVDPIRAHQENAERAEKDLETFSELYNIRTK